MPCDAPYVDNGLIESPAAIRYDTIRYVTASSRFSACLLRSPFMSKQFRRGFHNMAVETYHSFRRIINLGDVELVKIQPLLFTTFFFRKDTLSVCLIYQTQTQKVFTLSITLEVYSVNKH